MGSKRPADLHYFNLDAARLQNSCRNRATDSPKHPSGMASPKPDPSFKWAKTGVASLQLSGKQVAVVGGTDGLVRECDGVPGVAGAAGGGAGDCSSGQSGVASELV